MPYTYSDMIQTKGNNFSARLKMVKYAEKNGIRQAAREFACARNTVRTWLRRYEECGKAGLADLSRAPKTCPHKTSAYHEKKVVEARTQAPCFGPRRLKDLFELKPSQGAIARILRKNNLVSKRRKKYQKKNDLRAIKSQYAAFERVQADTKPLYDILPYWTQMKMLKLPIQQYTHRDVKSGGLFIDYANELSTTYATLSSKRVIEHLQRWDVPLEDLKLSSDNGSEYGGTERYAREIGYHAEMERYGLEHRFLPPATPNAHGDVESSHRWIEEELFNLERFVSRRDFFEKVATYQRWWNFARPNYSKGGKTPAQILEESGVNPAVFLLPPADLDALFRNHAPLGQHLPVDTDLKKPRTYLDRSVRGMELRGGNGCILPLLPFVLGASGGNKRE